MLQVDDSLAIYDSRYFMDVHRRTYAQVVLNQAPHAVSNQAVSKDDSNIPSLPRTRLQRQPRFVWRPKQSQSPTGLVANEKAESIKEKEAKIKAVAIDQTSGIQAQREIFQKSTKPFNYFLAKALVNRVLTLAGSMTDIYEDKKDLNSQSLPEKNGKNIDKSKKLRDAEKECKDILRTSEILIGDPEHYYLYVPRRDNFDGIVPSLGRSAKKVALAGLEVLNALRTDRVSKLYEEFSFYLGELEAQSIAKYS